MDRLSPGATGGLEAAIFDVDGTLADTERHGHRVAFNLAFEHLGLPDRWDEELYGELLHVPGGRRRLDHHLSARGMPEPERARLVPALHEAKNRYFVQLVRQRRVPVRPGVCRLLDELAAAAVRVAVATTGSRSWVTELLDRLLGPDRAGRFAAVVTGEEVSHPKPDPEIYRLALGRLGCGPAGAVAVEDSGPGLRAAKAAGLACLVVVNGYTRDHDLAAADLVVEELGEPGHRPAVLHNPHAVDVSETVGPPTLERLLAAAARRRVAAGP